MRLPALSLFLARRDKGCDDGLVAWLDPAGGRAVDRYGPASSRSCESVCRESFSVGYVPDVDLLEGYDSGCLHERRVYLDASLIVEVGTGDSSSMDLPLEHTKLHLLFSSCLQWY